MSFAERIGCQKGKFRVRSLKTTYILYYSPTGRTRQAADGLTQSWPSERIWVDLSAQEMDPEKLRFGGSTACVFAVPCVGGRIPQLVRDRISRMHGRGADAVLLVTYGNTSLGDSLVELHDAAAGAGFFVRSAASAVAQHALCPDVAAGRPDPEDMRQLDLFGQLIRDLPRLRLDRLELPGQRPYRDSTDVHVVPRADFRCTQCGECAEVCPTHAIPGDDPASTMGGACTSCMACVEDCPSHARHLRDLDRAMIRRRLVQDGAFGPPKKNTVYLRKLGTLEEP